jgi:hypothetical protein
MNNNPFLSNKFKTIWLKHFKPKNAIYSFKTIKQAQFYKSKFFPLYINIGKNITNGMYYEIDQKENDYQGKTFLIHDVPQYFDTNFGLSRKLKVKKARQYKGFAANLTDFTSFEEYFNFKYKSKTRYNYNKNIKRLEASFNIIYTIYHGNISEKEYEKVFNSLLLIIERRFDSLGLDNNILSKKEYYRELAYNMILKKEAVFAVIYSEGEPISISLGFLSDNILFYAITTFDIDYYRYNMGHTSIMKLMNWCFDNNIKIFDFSKGEYEYKDRWSNLEYNFECHVIYDSRSLISLITGLLVYSFFVLKQGLRDRKVNYIFSKIKYIYKELVKSGKKIELKYQVRELPFSEIENEKLKKIDLHNSECHFLKEPLYSYLYSNPQKIDNLKFLKNTDKANVFYALGEKINLEIFVPETKNQKV